MATIKIRMHTWERKGQRDTRYQRNIAPREGFVDLDPITKKAILKPGEYKCKPWDTSISRKVDNSYINSRKELYSGLCFESKKQAEVFMEKHKEELDGLAKDNPIFHHWSIMTVNKNFSPKSKIIYQKDIRDR